MKLGFIGGGNMAAALIGGLRRRGAAGADIRVVEPDAQRRASIESEHGVIGVAAIDAALAQAELLVVAVKPAQVQGVCETLRTWRSPALIVSIAAGIPSAAIARWSASQAVVRAMPNTPALIGQGITGLYARPAVSGEQRAGATAALGGIGDVVWFEDEAMLDAVTAISGSGPAYVFYFIEALQAAARQMGMDAAQARHFVVQTFVGAAQLAAQSPEDASQLRERVTSKGGTTAAALGHLRAAGVDAAIIGAAQAALARSREMASTLSN